jgi:hypothetical protein
MPTLVSNPPLGFEEALSFARVKNAAYDTDAPRQRALARAFRRAGMQAAIEFVANDLFESLVPIEDDAPGLAALLELDRQAGHVIEAATLRRRYYGDDSRAAAITLAEAIIADQAVAAHSRGGMMGDAERESIRSMTLAAVEYEGEAQPELDLATQGRVRKIDRQIAEAREKLGPSSSEVPWKDTTRLAGGNIQPWNDEHWERDRRRAEAAAEAVAAYAPRERPVDFEITRQQWASFAEHGIDLVAELVERRLARELEELERMREILTGVRRQVEVISDGPVHPLAPAPMTMERPS